VVVTRGVPVLLWIYSLFLGLVVLAAQGRQGHELDAQVVGGERGRLVSDGDEVVAREGQQGRHGRLNAALADLRLVENEHLLLVHQLHHHQQVSFALGTQVAGLLDRVFEDQRLFEVSLA
jgi:hypothetical protein